MTTQNSSFLEIINASFAAGEVKTFVVAGGYFEIIEAPYPVHVRLMDRYGSARGVMKNAEASFYMRQGEFHTIEMTSDQAQSIRFAYGSSEAGTRRTAGVVQVVDGGEIVTSSEQSFSAYCSVGAVAAQNQHVQLWNPENSGVNAIVKRVDISVSAATEVYLRGVNAALTTLIGAAANKKIGAAASICERRSQSNPALLGGTALTGCLIPPNQVVNYEFVNPIILPPGSGVVVAPLVQNVFLYANFDFYQKLI